MEECGNILHINNVKVSITCTARMRPQECDKYMAYYIMSCFHVVVAATAAAVATELI